MQPYHFGQFIVHSSRGIIQVGMCCINHQIMFTGLYHTSFDIGRTGQRFKGLKGQRMVRNNKITIQFEGFINNLFGNIYTKKHTGCRLVNISNLHTGIIKVFL